MTMKRIALIGTALAAVALAGCSATQATGKAVDAPAVNTSQAAPSAAAQSASPTPTAAHSSASGAPSRTAAEDVNLLAAQMSTIKVGVVYTAATDVNHLLGRPGGYTSKATFVDSSINAADVQDDSAGSVDLGGSFEVYPTTAGATARGKYIEAAEAASGIIGHEYDYVAGPTLLRLSEALTPSQAAAIAAAFAHAAGVETTALSASSAG